MSQQSNSTSLGQNAVLLYEELILSALVKTEKSYGLQIHDRIFAMSDGYYDLSVATIYQNLSKLVDKGFIEEIQDDEILERRHGNRKRYYKITDRGTVLINHIHRTKMRLISGSYDSDVVI